MPWSVKQRLLATHDNRISKQGVIIIKAKEERSQIRNREHALLRLKQIIQAALKVPKKRVATRPKKSAVKKRLDSKT